ncbi:MAG: hypothetical protein M3R15_14710 [Acidobacteriota bacterium]|nr:hypothetical protein [Acidobacteriota bacterium]
MAVLICALLAASCGSPSSTPSTQTTPVRPPPTVQGLSATLEDEVRDVDNGRIKWSTYWKLCWDEYPKAQAYELQVMTSEGTSPKLRRQTDRCFRIEAAAGINDKSQGLLNRDQLLGLQLGQLAYRVRAVLDDDRFSEWSTAMALGRTTKQAQKP